MNVSFLKSRIHGLIVSSFSLMVIVMLILMQVQPVEAATTINSPVNPNLVIEDEFQGFGTSLAWWADVVGGWSEPERSEIINYLFSDSFQKSGQTVQGIKLSSVRYNLGASEPGVSYPVYDPHLPPRNGAWIDSLIQADGSYDWTVDANQRWVLEQAAQKGVVTFELFGNSPPWWMTYNGVPSGRYAYSQGCQASNLPGDYEDDYAIYLATVAQRFQEVGVNGPGSATVEFKTIEPFNEPSNGWWCWGNNQEGIYLPSWQQDTIINVLRDELDARGMTNTGISATDSNNYWSVWGEFDALSDTARGNLAQINAHGYAGSDPEPVRDRVEAYNLRFWQSEWGPADWGGYNVTSELDAALELATRVTNDLSYVEANAWQYWQAVEDSSRGAGYWGLIQAPLDGSAQTYAIQKQFYVLGQYSKFIRPGYLIIDAGNGKSVAAFDPATSKLVLVTYNDTADSMNVTFDLSRFTTTGAVAQVWRTSATENLAQLSSINVSSGNLAVSVPSNAVTTLVVSNVVFNAPTTTAEIVNNSHGFTYSGTWSETGYSGGQQGAYGLWDQDEHASQTTNAFATYTFYGTKVHYFGTLAPSSGKVAVSIDGGAETTVNAYNAVRVDGVKLWSSGNLTAGRHTLKVRITGQTGATGGGVWGNIDRVVVENTNWTLCANEGQTCSFTGTAEVRYGANGDYTRGVNTTSVGCNSTVFGDPAPGFSKKCYYRPISTTTLINLNSHKCAAVSGASTSAGADILQWSCTGGNEQKWILEKVTAGYRLKPTHAQTMCMDVSGASGNPGANILQWNCGSGLNQVWDFVYTRDGAYQLMPNHAAGLCADVSGAGLGNGADIAQWTCNGYNNQMWILGGP